MTPAETLTLAAYFFVLIILAIYGWHRYYLVYLYMKYRDKGPTATAALDPTPGRDDPAPALQRDVRRRSPHRGGVSHRIPAGPPGDPGAGRLDRRDAEHCRAGGPAFCRAGRGHQVLPPRGSRRVQGGRARGRVEGGARRVRRHLRRGLHPVTRFPDPPDAALRRPARRHGAGAVGPHQPGLLAADEDSVDPARRPLRPRARRAESQRPLLQLQRHGRGMAPRGDRRRRRLAARYADRGSGSQLPRPAPRLAVRLPLRPDCPGRSAGRDERVQVAAAPLGQGIGADVPQAAAADSAVGPAARR